MLFASPLRIRCMTLWHLHTCSRTDSKRRAHVWIAADLEHASRQASKTLKLLRIHGVPAEKANITRAMAAQVNSVRDLGMKWHTQERQTCHSFYKTSWKEQWQIYNYIPIGIQVLTGHQGLIWQSRKPTGCLHFDAIQALSDSHIWKLKEIPQMSQLMEHWESDVSWPTFRKDKHVVLRSSLQIAPQSYQEGHEVMFHTAGCPLRLIFRHKFLRAAHEPWQRRQILLVPSRSDMCTWRNGWLLWWHVWNTARIKA